MKIKRILIGLVVLWLVSGAAVFILMGRKVAEFAKQDFSMIDISKLPDGTYQGSASAVLVNAQAEVTVHAGHITEVKLLKHGHGIRAMVLKHCAIKLLRQIVLILTASVARRPQALSSKRPCWKH